VRDDLEEELVLRHVVEGLEVASQPFRDESLEQDRAREDGDFLVRLREDVGKAAQDEFLALHRRVGLGIDAAVHFCERATQATLDEVGLSRAVGADELHRVADHHGLVVEARLDVTVVVDVSDQEFADFEFAAREGGEGDLAPERIMQPLAQRGVFGEVVLFGIFRDGRLRDRVGVGILVVPVDVGFVG
jgi:hypothetical protein